MTIPEFQVLSQQEFQFIGLDKDDNVMFAIPIPGVKAWRFEREEDLQSFIWDDEEITAARDAWETYMGSLAQKAKRGRPRLSSTPRTEIKICMDADTKSRLQFCAHEQRKSVSQLVTDWVWSHTSKTDSWRDRT